MKNLFISIICLLFLIVPWLLYDHYSTGAIKFYSQTLEEDVIPSINRNDWDSAIDGCKKISDDWERFKNISEFFLDTEEVNETTRLINRTMHHIEKEDMSNAAADSAELVHQLNYLHENEIISLGNVF